MGIDWASVGELSPREQLAHYRRTVSELYARVRALPPEEGWSLWRRVRDELFGHHPQSALPAEARQAFRRLEYFPYDPQLRFLCRVEPLTERPVREVELAEDGLVRLEAFGRVRFEHGGHGAELTLSWLGGYGGGIFMPFRDATSGRETYGGGRYLLDTIKGADLGTEGDRLVIDFNFAYNPSCAYDPRWSCPLAPGENWLPLPIRAGERS